MLIPYLIGTGISKIIPKKEEPPLSSLALEGLLPLLDEVLPMMSEYFDMGVKDTLDNSIYEVYHLLLDLEKTLRLSPWKRRVKEILDLSFYGITEDILSIRKKIGALPRIITRLRYTSRSISYQDMLSQIQASSEKISSESLLGDILTFCREYVEIRKRASTGIQAQVTGSVEDIMKP